MPTISYFFGIKIRMYIRDHAPPHFHASYAGDTALIEIETGATLAGKLPPAAARLVREWAEMNVEALRENWRLAQAAEPLKSIEGLDAH